MKFISRLRDLFFTVGIMPAMRILCGGLHGYGFTVFFLPVSQDLGLNRAQTSLVFTKQLCRASLRPAGFRHRILYLFQ